MAKSRTQKPKYKVGNVIAVPLPDGKYAFAKIYNNLDLGVYDFVSNKIEPLSTVLKHKIAFFKHATDRPIKSGAWPIIGEEPFPTEESAWGPPKAIGVYPGLPINPRMLKIAYKGALRRATPEEVDGLDIGGFSQRPDLFTRVVVDRLVNGNHDDYRVKL